MKTPMVQFQLVFIPSVTKLVRMKSEPQVGVSVVPKVQTIKVNNSLTQLHDLYTHLNLENSVITEDFIQHFSNKTPQPVSLERLHDVTLSRSQYRVTSLIDLCPHKNIFPSLIEYGNGLKRSLHHYADIKRYSLVNSDQPIMHEEKSLN